MFWEGECTLEPHYSSLLEQFCSNSLNHNRNLY